MQIQSGAQNQTCKNYWLDLGKSQNEVNERANNIWYLLKASDRYGFCVETGNSMYFYDTGNLDVRTEGQSYGMLASVLMEDQESFDKIWHWTLKNMYLLDGPCRGYFAWSVPLDGRVKARGPAPDGEEFFAAALILADRRWGSSKSGEIICLNEPLTNYIEWSRIILRDVLHRKDGEAGPMWTQNNLIEFVPDSGFTDPSYHVPHFYRLFAQVADERDRSRWLDIEQASLVFLPLAMHPLTGMCPEYSTYEGEPIYGMDHHYFYSDSYRTILNVVLSGSWPEREKLQWMSDRAAALTEFFCAIPTGDFRRYEIDGTDGGINSLHPVGLLATLGSAYMLNQSDESSVLAERFWETDLQTGARRYYDNFLYAFSFLALAGLYRDRF